MTIVSLGSSFASSAIHGLPHGAVCKFGDPRVALNSEEARGQFVSVEIDGG